MNDGAAATYTRDGSKINRTETALMSRGLDNETAAQLRKKGWTLGKLKQCSEKKLMSLGLSPIAIKAIHMGNRPDIPFENLIQVLVANRFTCCVCHDPSKSIIVHHIRDWAVSHNHSPENLAALCLDHHDKAHSKSSISRNLDEATLKKFKIAWEEAVSQFNAAAILDASRLQSDAWLYFNHLRLFELAHFLKICLKDLEHYQAAVSCKLINSKGDLLPRPNGLDYMYSGSEGMTLYDYVRDVMHEILRRLTVLNVSDYLERGLLLPILKSGDFIFVQGAHTFAKGNNRSKGRNQVYTGTRRANHVEVSYKFNRWEATSCSAWSNWLSGRQDTASLIRVVKVERGKNLLCINGTVMGIAFAFDGLKTREYSNLPYRPNVILFDDDNDEAEDDFFNCIEE